MPAHRRLELDHRGVKVVCHEAHGQVQFGQLCVGQRQSDFYRIGRKNTAKDGACGDILANSNIFLANAAKERHAYFSTGHVQPGFLQISFSGTQHCPGFRDLQLVQCVRGWFTSVALVKPVILFDPGIGEFPLNRNLGCCNAGFSANDIKLVIGIVNFD